MVFEKVEALFTNTFDLCRNAVNQDSTAKAERAVAFHRKLIEQDIIQLTSDLQDKLVLCEEMLHAAQASASCRSDVARLEQETNRAEIPLPFDLLAVIFEQVTHFSDDLSRSTGKNTLRPLTLCNKTFCSIAQPMLFREVKVNSFAQLLHFAYALHLQPAASEAPLRVKSLRLRWS